MSWAEWLENRAEERAKLEEEEEILVEAQIGVMEMLEEMQMEAETREAIEGQVD